MRKPSLIPLALMCAITLFAGCSTLSPRVPVSGSESMSSFEAAASGPLEQSLFASDTGILSNEAVASILGSQVGIKDDSVLAILRIPGSRSIQKYYGYNYWTSEKYFDTQERLNKALTDSIASKRIAGMEYMPSLIIPRSLSIPLIREAATRLQADLVLVFGEQSNIFNEYRLFQSVKIRAYASCEYVLLDTRTGVILSSGVITKKLDTEKTKEDLNNNEAFLRAETDALEAAMRELGAQVGGFIEGS